MAYEYSRDWRLELQYEGNATPVTEIEYRCVKEGQEVVPTSGTIALYSPGGTELLAATSMTVDGSPSPILRYTADLSDTDDFELGEHYRAEIVWTDGTDTFTDRLWFDVVRVPLHPTLVDDQLYEYEPELEHTKPRGQTNWAPQIRRAWRRLMSWVRAARGPDGEARPALLAGYDQLEDVHILLALAIIYGGQPGGAGTGTVYTRDQADRYMQQAEAEWDRVSSGLRYASGDSATADDEYVNFGGGRLVP